MGRKKLQYKINCVRKEKPPFGRKGLKLTPKKNSRKEVTRHTRNFALGKQYRKYSFTNFFFKFYSKNWKRRI